MTRTNAPINDSAVCLEVAAHLIADGGAGDIASALRLLGRDDAATIRRVQKRFKAHGSVYREIVTDAAARRIAGVKGPGKPVEAQRAQFRRRSA